MSSHKFIVAPPRIEDREVVKPLLCGPGPCDYWPSVEKALSKPVLSPICDELFKVRIYHVVMFLWDQHVDSIQLLMTVAICALRHLYLDRVNVITLVITKQTFAVQSQYRDPYSSLLYFHLPRGYQGPQHLKASRAKFVMSLCLQNTRVYCSYAKTKRGVLCTQVKLHE